MMMQHVNLCADNGKMANWQFAAIVSATVSVLYALSRTSPGNIMKRINFKQEDGYVLPYLLVALLLITTTLVLTVNLFYFYNKYEIIKTNKKKLELACSSAIQQFISQNSGKNKTGYTLRIDSTEVNLACRQKGLYLQVSVFAKNRLDSTMVTYLLAESISPPFENAVVISKASLNAAVAGKTKVVGDIVGSSSNYKMENLPGPGVGKASGRWIEGKTKIEEMIPQKLFTDSLFVNVISQKNNIESSRIKTYNMSVTLDSNTFRQYDSLSYCREPIRDIKFVLAFVIS